MFVETPVLMKYDENAFCHHFFKKGDIGLSSPCFTCSRHVTTRTAFGPSGVRLEPILQSSEIYIFLGIGGKGVLTTGDACVSLGSSWVLITYYICPPVTVDRNYGKKSVGRRSKVRLQTYLRPRSPTAQKVRLSPMCITTCLVYTLRTAVSLWGQKNIEFEWFCPQNGTAVLKSYFETE